MSWPPEVTLRCTAWEFWCAFNGWQAANNPDPSGDAMTRNELDGYIREYGLDGG